MLHLEQQAWNKNYHHEIRLFLFSFPSHSRTHAGSTREQDPTRQPDRFLAFPISSGFLSFFLPSPSLFLFLFLSARCQQTDHPHVERQRRDGEGDGEAMRRKGWEETIRKAVRYSRRGMASYLIHGMRKKSLNAALWFIGGRLRHWGTGERDPASSAL